MALTQEQQELAEKHLAFARSLAKPMKRLWPTYWNDYESAACLGLVEAAQSYDKSLNINFLTYARFRIRGAILDTHRTLARQDRARKAAYRKNKNNYTPQLEIELLDAIEPLLKTLPRKYAEICRQIYAHHKSQAEVAEILGCSASLISIMHKASIEQLQGVRPC